MDQSERVSLDVAGIKALAHPMRLRLVGLLRVGGPATATELARRLGDTTSGTTSWHLRRLAKTGFVVEAPGQSGRERRWAAAHRVTSWDPATLLDQPGGAAALAQLLHEIVALWTSRTLDFVHNLDRIDRRWVEVAAFDDAIIRLTPEKLTELRLDLDRVVERYRELGGEIGADGRRVWVQIQAIPYDRAH